MTDSGRSTSDRSGWVAYMKRRAASWITSAEQLAERVGITRECVTNQLITKCHLSSELFTWRLSPAPTRSALIACVERRASCRRSGHGRVPARNWLAQGRSTAPHLGRRRYGRGHYSARGCTLQERQTTHLPVRVGSIAEDVIAKAVGREGWAVRIPSRRQAVGNRRGSVDLEARVQA